MHIDSAAVARTEVTGVLLAGGKARRMDGQDKGLLLVATQPLVAHAHARLHPQVATIIINANRNAEQYAAWGDVVADQHSGFCGPLAGICAGMLAAKTPWILSVPCDTPFFPKNLAAHLMDVAMVNRADVVVAKTDERAQPVFMLAKCALAQNLSAFLDDGGRKIDLWYPQHSHAYADFADSDSFMNINTPEELTLAEKRMATSASA